MMTFSSFLFIVPLSSSPSAMCRFSLKQLWSSKSSLDVDSDAKIWLGAFLPSSNTSFCFKNDWFYVPSNISIFRLTHSRRFSPRTNFSFAWNSHRSVNKIRYFNTLNSAPSAIILRRIREILIVSSMPQCSFPSKNSSILLSLTFKFIYQIPCPDMPTSFSILYWWVSSGSHDLVANDNKNWQMPSVYSERDGNHGESLSSISCIAFVGTFRYPTAHLWHSKISSHSLFLSHPVHALPSMFGILPMRLGILGLCPPCFGWFLLKKVQISNIKNEYLLICCKIQLDLFRV